MRAVPQSWSLHSAALFFFRASADGRFWAHALRYRGNPVWRVRVPQTQLLPKTTCPQSQVLTPHTQTHTHLTLLLTCMLTAKRNTPERFPPVRRLRRYSYLSSIIHQKVLFFKTLLNFPVYVMNALFLKPYFWRGGFGEIYNVSLVRYCVIWCNVMQGRRSHWPHIHRGDEDSERLLACIGQPGWENRGWGWDESCGRVWG